MSQRQVTSYDVARHAGVSQPTVSRAFDPNGNINAKTRARVLQAAAELGYQPNAIARGLTTQRTDIVGIIMGNIARSYFYPNVLVQFTRRLQAMGKQVLLFNTHETRPVDEILPRFLSYHVDALIVASNTPGRELIDKCTSMGTPVVLLNRTVPDTTANAVCSDNEMGGRIVADLLLDAGHKRLAFVTGVEVTATNELRQKGFTERLKERSYGDVLLGHGEYTYDSGFEAALRLLDQDNPPDGIFCAADIMALGAMDAARYRLGIQVPDELSIVGYDDIPMASWPAYDLTTIRQSASKMVEAAVSLLTSPKDHITTGQVILLPGELVQRGSAKLRKSQL
ncbi:LacI family DNA-binding transcriptional regulator [Candidatus Leptofilum sp.]|uniref:LacI family DNA-binding transcriptional regulator n=1 Tax=Candidatus Leptofilum sp. TaxID=3241576 RepID=UPI003B5A5105